MAEFKSRNKAALEELTGAGPASEEAMRKYREELDKERTAKLARGWNHADLRSKLNARDLAALEKKGGISSTGAAVKGKLGTTKDSDSDSDDDSEDSDKESTKSKSGEAAVSNGGGGGGGASGSGSDSDKSSDSDRKKKKKKKDKKHKKVSAIPYPICPLVMLF